MKKYFTAIIIFYMGVCFTHGGYSRSRYKVIIDREPFGAIPVVTENTAPAPDPLIPETAPKFIKSLRMCSINESDDYGLRVGIVDIKAKPAKSYFFKVGETQDGLTLLEADFKKEGALIKKGDKAFWIYLDGTTGNGREKSGGSNSYKPSTSVLKPVTAATRSRSSIIRRGSYAERLRKRREILEARRKKNLERLEAKKNKTPEQLKAEMQAYQMELIRAGGKKGPAMPIPLTPEMDDELVREGVLPPQE